jgi:hypothetical protein
VTLKDLSQSSYCPTDDLAHVHNLQDIDCISNMLGIPWECLKDIPFLSSIPFIGFVWDIDKKIVTLHKEKQNKYLNTIKTWQSLQTHMLEDVQKLFGKLLHTCLILPHGWAYLTGLEAMLGIFKDMPSKPHHPPHGTQADLAWWYHIFSLSTPISQEIPPPVDPIDVQAFSDTSSSISIGIVIVSG